MIFMTPAGQSQLRYLSATVSPNTFGGAIINPDGSLNDAEHPAPQGATLTMYGTGFGRTSPPELAGVLSAGSTMPIPLGNVSVLVGSLPATIPATVLAVSQVPNQIAGFMQATIRLPLGLPSKTYVMFLVDGTCSLMCSPVSVYMQQSAPPPTISDVSVAYAFPYVVASSGSRDVVVSGNGFQSDSVLELYSKEAGSPLKPAPRAFPTVLCSTPAWTLQAYLVCTR